MIEKTKNSTANLESISLAEMDTVKLMNRTDTKFPFNVNLLPEILGLAKENYLILEVSNTRTPSYKTLYFDTAGFKLFLDHHNDRGYRYKVRIRNYVESGLYFLEIKKKVAGRTIKDRIKLDKIYTDLDVEQSAFIQKTSGENAKLNASIWNSFNRITLVNKHLPERITIDFNLVFEYDDIKIPLGNIAIAEVKQERTNLHSPFIRILKKFGIRESAISKYCIGTLLTNEGVKYNNFKQKLLLIDKINKAA